MGTEESMLELYAIPYACSLAVHLCLRQRGLDHRVHWLTRGRRHTEDGEDFLAVNPKAKVAALRLADGELLTENITILLEIDAMDRTQPRSDGERRQLVTWLSFVATELHKQIAFPAYDPSASESTQQDVRTRFVPPVLAFLDRHLGGSTYLMGESPSVADAYGWWALWLLGRQWPEVIEPPNIARFVQAMKADPELKPTLDIERAEYLRQRAGAGA